MQLMDRKAAEASILQAAGAPEASQGRREKERNASQLPSFTNRCIQSRRKLHLAASKHAKAS
jgi:hypothetical protein